MLDTQAAASAPESTVAAADEAAAAALPSSPGCSRSAVFLPHDVRTAASEDVGLSAVINPDIPGRPSVPDPHTASACGDGTLLKELLVARWLGRLFLSAAENEVDMSDSGTEGRVRELRELRDAAGSSVAWLETGAA